MTALVAGLALGLAAGISPGPLQALVVTSSLRGGFGSGWRVAVAPLLTDAPIVAIALLVAAELPDVWLVALAVGGGALVVAFGLWEIRAARTGNADVPARYRTSDLWRGVIINALSPHPWLFWVAVGGPALLRSWRQSPALGVAFLLGFYLLLIGSKVVLAAVVAAGGKRLSEGATQRLRVVGGLVLVVAGVLLAADALG